MAFRSVLAVLTFLVLLADADKIDLVGIYDGQPGPGDIAKLVFTTPLHFLVRFD